jgi:hypothetical protein
VAVALGIRAKASDARTLYARYLASYDGVDPVVLEFSQREALDLEHLSTDRWDPNLKIISNRYARGIVSDATVVNRMSDRGNFTNVPLKIARKIAIDADIYPSFLVALAEARCRENVASRITPVAEIARREGWFAD